MHDIKDQEPRITRHIEDLRVLCQFKNDFLQGIKYQKLRIKSARQDREHADAWLLRNITNVTILSGDSRPAFAALSDRVYRKFLALSVDRKFLDSYESGLCCLEDSLARVRNKIAVEVQFHLNALIHKKSPWTMGSLIGTHLAQSVSLRSTTLPRIRPAPAHQRRNTTCGWRWEAPGLLDGGAVDALADSGSAFNAIDMSFAKALALPMLGSPGSLSLPNGSVVETLGYVNGRFTFSGERKQWDIDCVVLERCSHNLVLGSRFLQMTETLTKNMLRRLRKVFSSFPSVCLLGGHQDRLSGYLNGTRTHVIPDTGSEIMAMSASHTAKLGLEVLSDAYHRTRVKFIDGTEGLTDGMVKSVRWQFATGGPPRVYDFHIINDLPVDAIVGVDFLHDLDVFSKYQDQITEWSPDEDQAGIYGISLIKSFFRRGQKETPYLEAQAQSDRKFSAISLHIPRPSDLWQILPVASEDPFSPAMECRELGRGDEARNRISKLQPHEQSIEQRKEDERIHDWEMKRANHVPAAARPGSAPQYPPAPSTGSTPTAAGNSHRTHRWRGIKKR